MEPLADNLRRELVRLGPQADVGRIAEAWPAAVGEQIARNAWPARLSRDGTLHVHASSSAWAFELTQLESDIRTRLGEEAPKRLRFAVGPLPGPGAATPDEAVRNVAAPTDADRDEAADLAASIGDEKLRNLVARAAAASLARARDNRSF